MAISWGDLMRPGTCMRVVLPAGVNKWYLFLSKTNYSALMSVQSRRLLGLLV